MLCLLLLLLSIILFELFLKKYHGVTQIQLLHLVCLILGSADCNSYSVEVDSGIRTGKSHTVSGK